MKVIADTLIVLIIVFLGRLFEYQLIAPTLIFLGMFIEYRYGLLLRLHIKTIIYILKSKHEDTE